MRLERTLRRIAGTPDDLRRAARDLGHELPRKRWNVLARFREGASMIVVDSEFKQGYKEALLDVTAAFTAAEGDS